MRKFIALSLVISLLGMNCATYERGEGINLSPDQKPGVKLIIQKTDSQKVGGELIAVKQNSLLLKESSSGADISVEISEIKVIKIVRKSKAVVWGSGVGFIFLILGLAFANAREEDLLWEKPSLGEYLLMSMFYTLPFVGIGALLGKDQVIRIRRKSESDIKDILDDLRKKARVPDYQ